MLTGQRRKSVTKNGELSTDAAVPGVHLERACRHAERRRPNDAVGVVRHRVTAAGCGRGVEDTAAECTWPAVGKASQEKMDMAINAKKTFVCASVGGLVLVARIL